jgi:hypothetical protein
VRKRSRPCMRPLLTPPRPAAPPPPPPWPRRAARGRRSA